jgi:pteridine reductase
MTQATNKVAIVTGSGKRRVGNAVVCALAERGYSLVVHYRRSARDAAATVDHIRKRGTNAVAIEADVADEVQVDRLVRQSLDEFGRIDVLVNTAAIWRPRPLEQVTAADLREHFDANTLGTFLCSRLVGLQMVRQPEGGSIITVGEWAIERPYLNYAAYFVSKGAIPTLTRTLAVELGGRNPRVRVNCIMPGPVMVPDDMPPNERESVIASTLVKRAGQPEHFVQAVSFLVDNDFVTGTCVTVDGGRTICAG